MEIYIMLSDSAWTHFGALTAKRHLLLLITSYLCFNILQATSPTHTASLFHVQVKMVFWILMIFGAKWNEQFLIGAGNKLEATASVHCDSP